MQRILFVLLTALAVSVPALANEELAKEKKCTKCHSVDRTKVGASYKDLAKKYAGQADAPAKLAANIIKGVKGSGEEMPPNPQVSEADAKALANWILSLK
jgi:cytochrome c